MTTLDNENELLLSFNRGGEFSSHYFEDCRGKNLHSGNFVSHFGIFFGVIVDVQPHKGVLHVAVSRTDLQINVGDTVAIRDGNKDIITFPVGKFNVMTASDLSQELGLYGAHPDQLALIHPSFSLYLVARKKPYSKPFAVRLPISFRIEYHKGDKEIAVTASSQNERTFSLSDKFLIDPSYSGGALTLDRIITQLSKSGGTSFHVTNVDISGDIPNVPVSFLNHIRRTILDAFERHYLTSFKRFFPIEQINTSHQGPIGQKISPNIEKRTNAFLNFQFALEYINLKSVNCNIAEVNYASTFYVFSMFDIVSSDTVTHINDILNRSKHASFAIRLNASSRFLQDQEMRSKVDPFISMYTDQFLGFFTDAPTEDGNAFVITHQANITNSSALSVLTDKNPAAVELSHEMDNRSLEQLICLSYRSSEIPLMFQIYGPIEWMMSHYCPVGKNVQNCTTCANGAKTFQVSRNRDREYDMARLVLRPMNCTSELFGPPKYDRSELIGTLLQQGKNMLRLIRVLDQEADQLSKILSEIGAEA